MDDISTGAGILVGLLALSFVLLVIKTRDKWKWGRIIFAIIAIPVIGILALIGIEYYRELPKPTLEYAGLSLNMPKEDVIFLKGQPREIIDSGPRKVDELLIYSASDYGDTMLIVGVEDDKVLSIVYGGDPNYESGLYGVFIGSEYAHVIKKLGEPTKTKKQTDVSRGLYYANYNIQVGISKGEVISLGISVDPEVCDWVEVSTK